MMPVYIQNNECVTDRCKGEERKREVRNKKSKERRGRINVGF
jgi:hypothetical protein